VCCVFRGQFLIQIKQNFPLEAWHIHAILLQAIGKNNTYMLFVRLTAGNNFSFIFANLNFFYEKEITACNFATIIGINTYDFLSKGKP
jgi:hypothetical protein